MRTSKSEIQMIDVEELLTALKLCVRVLTAASNEGGLYGKHDVAWQQMAESVCALINKAESKLKV